MAEKIFTNVRLGLKVDTLEKWNSSSLVLKKGEVAFATVAASAGTGLAEPVVMMKIGDGEHTFSELKFDFYAKSSDVLAACKTTEGLTAFVNNVIAGSGLATDGAMEELSGKVTVAEGKITTLEGKMTAVEGKASANETAIGVLNGDASTAGSVAKSIADAIAALKLDETYAAKSHKHEIADVNGLSDSIADAKKAGTDAAEALGTYKTLNDAAVKVNSDAISGIKNGTSINNFAGVETALAGKETAGAAAQALTDAKAYADGLAGNYDAAGSASAAESAAKAYAKEYADGLAGNYDAAGTGEAKANAALEAAKKYTDDEIAELDLANTYAAKEHTHTKSEITDFAHTHAMSEINGLSDEFAKYQLAGDYATKSEAQGYADAKDEAIAAAKKAGDDAQDAVDALGEFVGELPEGVTATTIVGYVQEKTAGIATDAALGELQSAVDGIEGRMDDAEAAIEAIEKDYLVEADKTELQGNIDDLAELVGEGKVADRISAAVEAEANRAKGIEGDLEERLAAVEGDYLVEADKTELEGKIKSNADAIELLTNGVGTDEIDSVNELITYVNNHGATVTGLQDGIKANSEAIAAEKERAMGIEGGLETRLQAVEGAVGETGSVATAIEEAMEEAKGHADGLNTAMNTRVEALEAIDHSHDNMAVLNGITSDKVTAWDGSLAAAKKYTRDYVDPIDQAWNNLRTQDVGRISVLEKASHTHANKDELDKFVDGDKAKLDSAVQSVTAAATSGLKATRTGNDIAIEIDDSITFVFDCGNSEM